VGIEKAKTIVNGKNKSHHPLLYIGAIKVISATRGAEPERSKITERLDGPTFRTGLGSATITLSHKAAKSAKSFDNHAFEGEGNVFLGTTIKEACAC
jgi:hypothetical protein